MAAISVIKMKKTCVEVSLVLKALAHPQRLMIMGHLLQGSKTVTDLVEACGVSQPQISHFLMRMKIEGLVRCEREGRYMVYSVADKRLERLMRAIQRDYCE